MVTAVLVAAFLALAAALLSGCALPGSGGTTSTVSTAGTRPTASTEKPTTSTSAPSTTTSTASPSAYDAVRPAVAAMTLRQKAAQVLMVTPDATTFTTITQGAIDAGPPAGFVLLGSNVESQVQLTALTAALQRAASSAGAPGLFIAADEEGGTVMRVKAGVPDLPGAREMAAGSTPSMAQALATETAAGLRKQGVNMVFAPVADVVADPDSFLYDRSYGDSPGTVSRFVTAVTKGFEAGGMITVVKHFPGHGSAPENSHTLVPVSTASLEDFQKTHLPPFAAAIKAKVDAVMVAHIVASAYDKRHPASQSPRVIEDLLRGDLHFGGLVVSDDMEMAAAVGQAGAVGSATPDQLGHAAVGALAAGCDVLITTSPAPRQAIIRDAIVTAVGAGTLSEERLDDAVTRILALKLEHGIPVPGVAPIALIDPRTEEERS